jgi:hypothetical protein
MGIVSWVICLFAGVSLLESAKRHNWSFPMGGFGRTEGRELRFDLTDMRLFLTVVEQGSLTKGAESMNLALASVSERISGMDSSLGAQLLERNRRGVLRLRPVMP